MKIFCSGIGGIGLSAYAALQNAEGNIVCGSDRSDSALLGDLGRQGIGIFFTQDGSALGEDTELFVYSEAIPEDSPERTKAKKLGIRSVSYFQALGDYLRERKLQVIAVCGTHGKSSTTAMLAKVFADAGKDPTVVVGTKVPDLGGTNWRRGESAFAIIEACEYRGSFLYLSPTTILLTNADGDHFDVFASAEAYQDAFISFLQKLPKDGVVITHGTDSLCTHLAEKAERKIVDADTLTLPTLSIPGTHMQQNAALALETAVQNGIEEDTARKSLQDFAGTWRRMERKGETVQGVPVIDDYAHHPTEIRATLSAMKEHYPGKNLICVFQPHLWSRTKELYEEFTKAFTGAARVYLTDVYKARSEEEGTVSMEDFASDIAKLSGVECHYSGSLSDAESTLKRELKEGDLLLIMGAGSIAGLAERLVS